MKLEYRGFEFEFATIPSPGQLEARYQEKLEQIRLASERQKGGVTRHEYGDEAPLSSGQRRLWFLQRVRPSSVAYAYPRALRLTGKLNTVALRDALTALVARHEVLRTILPERDGTPYQKIQPAPEVVAWDEVDLSAAGDRLVALDRLKAEAIRRPFDLTSEVPLRISLVRLGPDEHELLLHFHHIATDRWSDFVLRRELLELYDARVEGRAPKLQPLAVQYADFALREQQQLETDSFSESLAFWGDFLDGAPAHIEWNTGSAPTVTESAVGILEFDWGSKTASLLHEFSKRSEFTVFEALLAGFQAFLARETGQKDLVVSTPVTLRQTPELQELIGFFANTVPTRARVPLGESFEQWSAKSRTDWRRTLRHQRTPFHEITEVTRRRNRRALTYDTSFTLQHEASATTAGATVGGVSIVSSEMELGEIGAGLSLEMSLSDHALSGVFYYHADQFGAAWIRNLSDRFERFIERCLLEPERPMLAHDLVDTVRRTKLVDGWATGERLDVPAVAVHQLFEQQVHAGGARTALIHADGNWSYARLNQAANVIARELRQRGVGPEFVVGVSLERSPLLLASLLGVLKAGGAYLALQPDLPAERLEYMASDSATRLVLCDASGEDACDWNVPVIRVDAIEFGSEAEDLGLDIDPESLAYILYTSGSTGRPKGVEMRHGPVTNLIAAIQDRGVFTREDVVLWKTPYGFDVSVSELFNTLAVGACLVVGEPGMERDVESMTAAIRTNQVTVLRMVPTALEMLVNATSFELCSSVRRVICAGEALTGAVARSYFERGGGELFNLLGATETCVDTTFFQCEAQDDSAMIGVGTPLQNYRTYVLDDALDLYSAESRGELYVGGAGLARGYRAMPSRTALSFVPDPHSKLAGARMYRTGDVVAWTAGGRLEYVGRADNQLQVRGIRVELLEVETLLAAVAGVRSAAVRAVNESSGRADALTAYLVFEEGHERTPAELRSELKRNLAEAVVPTRFVKLEAMPRTPSGKVDRNALPEPDASLRTATQTLPRTATEESVAAIWRERLGLEQVGVHEHFFEIGGHSMLAVRLQADLVRSLDLDIPLNRLIEAPTIAALAEWIDLQGDARASRIPRHEYGDEAPASSEQRRMWFLQNLSPDSVAYQVPLPVKLRGALDLGALQLAVRDLMERHEVLRTVYVERNGEPVQRIMGVPDVLPWTFEDVSDASEPDRLARERVEAAIATPFDLRVELPIRVSVFKLGEEVHILLLLFHHIAIDEWTTGVVVGELSELYGAHSESRDSRLIPMPVQYADYAVWQREQFGGPAHTEGLEYWKKHLSGAASRIEWPLGTDGTDGSHPSETVRFEWSEATSRALLQYSRAQKSSVFTTLYGAFAAFVARCSGQSDLTVGLPVTMRRRPELQGLVGFLLNTIPMRARVGLGDSFEAWLAQTRATWQQAMAHHWIPLEEIVRAARSGGPASGVPLFDTVFTFVPAEGRGSFAGLEADPLEAVELPEAKVALWVAMSEADGVLSGSFEFNSARFDRADIEQLVKLFEAFVVQCTGRPDAPMLAHPLLEEEQRRPLLLDWARGRSVGGVGAPVHQLFERCAASAPDDIAISSVQSSWTYGELNRRANRLANLLRRSGVTAGNTVGVEVERSPELIAALYGVLKAGGTYVALQPSLPDKRLAYMVEDASVRVTLTDDPARNELGGLRLDIAAMHDGAYSDANLDVALDPEDLAYVLYTSGSTGLPKGVMLPHRAVANLVGVIAEQYPEGADDAILQKTPYSFDISVSEIFNPLARGARLVMTEAGATKDPAYLRDRILEERVTVLRMTPTELGSLMDTEGIEACRTSVKRILACGEALTPAVCRKVQEKWPEVELINLWGPTEACVYASWWPFDRANPETIPIGKPLPNYTLYSLDDAFEPTPLEMKGELFAGGPSLARGYHGLPGKTALAYLPDPHAEHHGARMYASGDLVSWNRAGDLEFHGRRDNQVQLRGMRIELGELESALDEHEGVRLSAVRPIRASDGRVEALVAYVVLDEGHEPEVSELRAHMLGYVEESKIPGQFVRLEQMPLTPSGKIDRKALPEPDASLRRAERTLPRTETEESIAAIWRERLGLEQVGVHENFFEVGGHSLLAVRLQADLRNVTGLDIPLVRLVDAPTIAELAELVLELELDAMSDDDLDDLLAGFDDE